VIVQYQRHRKLSSITDVIVTSAHGIPVSRVNDVARIRYEACLVRQSGRRTPDDAMRT